MEKVVDIILIIVVIFVCIGLFLFGYYGGFNKGKTKAIENVIMPDTAYNKVTLDSIEYNIIKKDSVIYNIKQEMKDEVTKSFGLNDSAAVELFKKLVSTD